MTEREHPLTQERSEYGLSRRRCEDLVVEVAELRLANSELRVERDAADALLAQALRNIRKYEETTR